MKKEANVYVIFIGDIGQLKEHKWELLEARNVYIGYDKTKEI